MNGYYLFWTMLIVVSLWASLGGFLWAHRHGQFRDQDRARFMALRDEVAQQVAAKTRGAKHETFVLIGIIGIGIAAIFSVLAIAFLKTAGGGM